MSSSGTNGDTFHVLRDYDNHLRDAKPIVLPREIIHPPPGSMAAAKVLPETIIPPINTSIDFARDTKPFDLSLHPGLAAISPEVIPEEFRWSHPGDDDSEDVRKKKRLIAKPGNQALCGSCWAIAGAGIIGDNFVVSGVVDWKPNLSTTWSLSCFPQHRCQGGTPAKLFNDVARHGIVSNHCVDYSWCMTNELCNGKATGHFKASGAGGDGKGGGRHVNLSTLVPSCGCYYDTPHYLYKIDPHPKNIAIGRPGITEDNIAITVKKHIFTKGPVLGGFLVFKNFMRGDFTEINGGVYLERGVYNAKGGEIKFSDSQISPANYVGSHAVAIVGWGVQKGVVVDESGKKEDVPYWYCRNSWKETWGEGGFFKMAMYPWNKKSQFDRIVTISTPKGRFGAGGMVMISASKKPEKKTFKQIERLGKLLQSEEYYKKMKEEDMPEDGGFGSGKGFGSRVKGFLKMIWDNLVQFGKDYWKFFLIGMAIIVIEIVVYRVWINARGIVKGEKVVVDRTPTPVSGFLRGGGLSGMSAGMNVLPSVGSGVNVAKGVYNSAYDTYNSFNKGRGKMTGGDGNKFPANRKFKF